MQGSYLNVRRFSFKLLFVLTAFALVGITLGAPCETIARDTDKAPTCTGVLCHCPGGTSSWCEEDAVACAITCNQRDPKNTGSFMDVFMQTATDQTTGVTATDPAMVQPDTGVVDDEDANEAAEKQTTTSHPGTLQEALQLDATEISPYCAAHYEYASQVLIPRPYTIDEGDTQPIGEEYDPCEVYKSDYRSVYVCIFKKDYPTAEMANCPPNTDFKAYSEYAYACVGGPSLNILPDNQVCHEGYSRIHLLYTWAQNTYGFYCTTDGDADFTHVCTAPGKTLLAFKIQDPSSASDPFGGTGVCCGGPPKYFVPNRKLKLQEPNEEGENKFPGEFKKMN